MAAYRLPYLLVGDSVVLKQDSSYYEHFYNELRPWQHYIPIRANLGDLLEKIQWARDHDEEVMMITGVKCLAVKAMTCSFTACVDINDFVTFCQTGVKFLLSVLL